MSRSRGKRAAGASEQREPSQATISLATARKMLPLVSRIMDDIKARWQRLTALELEQSDLEQRRRKLDWPERSRRYQIGDEIKSEQERLQDAVVELEQLDLVLVDAQIGEIAFPTALNGRRAYFIWRSGAKDLGWWCYAHDPIRHAIPASWREAGR